MELLFKGITLASLLSIFYQDQKERQVFWWLFLLVSLSLSILHITTVGWFQFGVSLAFNTGIIASLLFVLMLYVKLRMPSIFFLQVFALGDVFFMVALALGFSTLSFVILLVFGLLFSLLLHQVWLRIFAPKLFTSDSTSPRDHKAITRELSSTVPLAGYLALFFTGVLVIHWLGLYDNLYLL